MHFFGAIWETLALNLFLIYQKKNLKDAETAPSNAYICDVFSEQHQHQSIKKAPYLMPFLIK